MHERRGDGMSGEASGTNGRKAMPIAVFLLVLLLAAEAGVNALSILEEARRAGAPVARWQPFALEYSSAFGLLLAMPLAWGALRAGTRVAGPLRFLAVAALALAFSGLHIVLMVGLRVLVWRQLGDSYSFDFADEWLYEFRKDLVTFLVMVAAFWLAERWSRTAQPAAAAAPADNKPSTIALPDGGRSVMIDPQDLAAVRSEGNYAELIFADGRRQLIRATLTVVEERLGGAGFVRTHRSWLVALRHARAVSPTASGDHVIAVNGGLQVPLSRRSAEALRLLRPMRSQA